MDLEQSIEGEAGSGRDVAFEKIAKDMRDGKSFERTSNAAFEIENRDVKYYTTEAIEISWARNEAAANGKFLFDVESGKKGGKRKTKDHIYGLIGRG